MTSDGQAFTVKHHAIDHSRKLEDKEITPFERKDLVEQKDLPKTAADPQQDAPFDYEKIDKELLDDREFLFARFEALYHFYYVKSFLFIIFTVWQNLEYLKYKKQY